MADPHWTSYVGMVTGIAGAIMGFVSYRKSNQIKKLDLRIELKRAATDLRFQHESLTAQIKSGNESRKAIAAAMGLFNSGMMEKWNKEFDSDVKTVRNMTSEIPNEETNYDSFGHTELESKLIEIHKTQNRLKQISNKYTEALAWDDEQRKQLREDQRAKYKLS